MYHSVHPQFFPPGYGLPNPARWWHPQASMTSSSSSSNDGPPPLEPINLQYEDITEDDCESTPPPLHSGPSHAHPMANVASLVKQHAYSAVWQATSIASVNPASGQRGQGSAPQGNSPAAPDRRQAPAEPSTPSHVQHNQANFYPQTMQSNVYNNYQHYNWNLQNCYQQSQLVQMQRQMVRTAGTYRPVFHNNHPPTFHGNVQNNYYPRSNFPSESFVQQERAFFNAQVPSSAGMIQNHTMHSRFNFPVIPPVSVVQSHIHQQQFFPPKPMPSMSEQSTQGNRNENCVNTGCETSVRTNTAPVQTTQRSAGEMQQSNALRAVNPVQQPEEPAPKRSKESERDDRNKSVPVPEVSQNLEPSEEDEPANLRRFRFLLENPLIIQNLILEEKKRIKEHGSNYLEIDLDIKPGRVLYQTIDFVRFHRIVQSGKVNVRLSETNVGPVVLVVHPTVINRFEQRTIDMKECADTHSLTDELLKPLDSTEYFVNYALLAHREHRCWELAGILGSLGEEADSGEVVVTEDVTGISNEAEIQLPSPDQISNADNARGESLPAMFETNVTPNSQEENTAERVRVTQATPLGDVFICRFCDKIYTSKRGYVRHLRAHEQAKGAFQCTSCEKDFVSKSSLHQHKLIFHRGEVNQAIADNETWNKQCDHCKSITNCMCYSRNAGSNSSSVNVGIDLNPVTRPIQIVTLEQLRRAFNLGVICARLSEKHTNTILVMRPEQEESFASESVDVRLVEDVGRISSVAADLVNSQPLPEYATRCAMLVYNDELGCWKLAGCLEPQISPGASSTDKETSDASAPLQSQSEESLDLPFSPRGVDPSSLLECVVESSPEKTRTGREGSVIQSRTATGENIGSTDSHFTNPLGEQSLEDIAVNHLMSMIPQQVNQQILDLINTMDLPPVPEKFQESQLRGARICKICFQTFKDQRSFVQHKVTHDSSIRVFECAECNHVTTRRDLLNRHVNRQHPVKTTGERNPA